MGYPIVDNRPRPHTYDVDRLNEAAQQHLWMHFSRLGAYSGGEIPIMAEGKGCYLWDARGKRYLDALSGLFTVQLGHGRVDLAETAREQAETLEYFPIWSYAHPPAIELAAKLAELAPGDLNRVFFTTGGSEAVESAWKLAAPVLPGHRPAGPLQGHRPRHRVPRHHDGRARHHWRRRSEGAVRAGDSGHLARDEHESVPPRARNGRRRIPAASSTDAIEQQILAEGPETVAAVCTSSRCRTPAAASSRLPDYFQRVREICDRYGVLLVSDEVICAFGRLGYHVRLRALRLPARHDHAAKGLTSGYSPLGAVICRDFLAEPFLSGTASFLHGITFGGHPVSCAVGLRNLELFEEEGILENVQANEAELRARIESLRDVPIVGDVRGAGYFLALELVAEPETRAAVHQAAGRGPAARLPVAAALRGRPDLPHR